MLSLIALIVLPYITYVFFSESLNPLANPTTPMLRSRRRYGKNMALSVLLGTVFVVALLVEGQMTLPGAIAFGGCIGLIPGSYFFGQRIFRKLRR